MPDVLEFHPNRDLGFNPKRERQFNPGRPRQFDHNRDLGFKPNRDLGFGKKGVVFRGFVCPVCGAGVSESDFSCMQCGAVFERRAAPRIGVQKPVVKGESAISRSPHSEPPVPAKTANRAPPPPVRMYPPPQKRVEITNCPYCGARLSATDAFCWNCGNRLERGGQ